VGLALFLALGFGARVGADEPRADEAAAQAAERAAQLQRNLHDMRLVIDRERAQQDGALRVNAAPLVIDSRDAPGIGRMREQLAQSLERLESRCFGIDVNVQDGNAILICGSNNGTAEGSNVTSSAQTTVVVPPPSPPSSPAAAEESEEPESLP
jgi:hypothetical protein